MTQKNAFYYYIIINVGAYFNNLLNLYFVVLLLRKYVLSVLV